LFHAWPHAALEKTNETSNIPEVARFPSTGEDGESKHWLRQFAFEGGTEFVHGPSYHTRNAKGIVAYAQFASMLPVEEYGKLIGKAIEDGVIDLPAHTIQFLLSTKT